MCSAWLEWTKSEQSACRSFCVPELPPPLASAGVSELMCETCLLVALESTYTLLLPHSAMVGRTSVVGHPAHVLLYQYLHEIVPELKNCSRRPGPIAQHCTTQWQ